MMFDRRHRLSESKSVRRVLRFGRTLHVPPLTLKYSTRRDAAASRFTVVVSTKVSKRATVRNRLKRQLRALLRLHAPAIPAHTDYVLILRPQTTLPTWANLAGMMGALCSRLRARAPKRS